MAAPDPDRFAAGADARLRFGLLAFLLALSLLLHQIWWDGFELSGPHFVVVLAAWAVLLRPTSVGRLVAMLAAEVLAVARDMPGAGSHTVLVAVCGAAVLAYTGWTMRSTRRLPEAGALFEQIAPFLRIGLLVLYAAATLAKLNAGFFDPAESCAAALSRQIAWFDPSLLDGTWRLVPAIWGTVLVEAALPVLLAWPRTRVAGLAIGTAFHLVLALAGNVPFSALVLALYVAFLPAGVAARGSVVVLARRPAWTHGARVGRWARPAALALLVAGWGLGALAARAAPASAQEAIGYGTRLVVVVVAAVILAVAVRRRGARRTPEPLGLRPGHPVFVVAIALLVANGMAPYLGLKTESSFTMFSNLQTEAGYWNHAFIPEAVRVFTYQDQLVTVTASGDPSLLRRSRFGTRIVRFELERHLRRKNGVRASYRDGSGRVFTAGAASDGGGVSFLIDKVAKFRDVRAPGRRGC